MTLAEIVWHCVTLLVGKTDIMQLCNFIHKESDVNKYLFFTNNSWNTLAHVCNNVVTHKLNKNKCLFISIIY